MRFMRLNKYTELPVNCLFVDCETKPVEELSTTTVKQHKLWYGVAIHVIYRGGKFTRRTDYTFTSPNHFLSILDKISDLKHRTWVFSHNAGFDQTIAGLWLLADIGAVTLDYLISESPPNIVRFARNSINYIWLDTLNWFRCSLKKLGESVGVSKLDMPTDTESVAEWCVYCTRDCEVIMKAIEALFQMHEELDLGNFRFTASSQAMQVFRHRFAPQQTVLRKIGERNGIVELRPDKVLAIEPHSNGLAKLIERDGYFQGKSWCYFLGRVVEHDQFMFAFREEKNAMALRLRFGPVYALDVNSLYPSVMADNYFPVRYRGILYYPNVETLANLCQKYAVVANVRVSSATIEFPVRLNKIPRFCVGEYWTTLCGPELHYALQLGLVEKCSAVTYYDQMQIFSEYVKFFYSRRCEYKNAGNSVFADLCKLYLVSLYGKFAQRNGSWNTDHTKKPARRWQTWTERDGETGKIRICRGVADLLQTMSDDEDTAHTFTAISAYVTSYGRMLMRKYEAIAGIGGCHYTNVDSLHVDQIAFRNLEAAGLISQDSLGSLKVQGVHQTAEYKNVRDYVLDGKETIAGVKDSAVKTATGSYEMLDFERLDSILNKPPSGLVEVRNIDVVLQRLYSCGNVNDDGSTRYKILKRGDTWPMFNDEGRLTSEDIQRSPSEAQA